MIVVTGATGQLGRAIILSLLEQVPADQIVASTRDPGQAADLAARGVEVRHGDYTDVDGLRAAFKGARQVLMISSNAQSVGLDPLPQHRNVIEAARQAGVGRIVYTSHMGASDKSAFSPMHTHSATETMLWGSGLKWTSLRNGFYASATLRDLTDVKETGLIQAPADGKVSWTTHDDLAAGTAAILAQEGRFDGPTPPLVATEALSLADIARIAAHIVGRPVRLETLSDEAMSALWVSRGLPPYVVDIQLGLYRAERAGEFAALDPTLSHLIGRPTQRLQDYLATRIGEVPRY